MASFTRVVVTAVCLAWATGLGAAAAAPASSPVGWVNTYIGTGGGDVDYGGTMPLVTTPFGMTNWTAQTRQNRISVTSYAYEDTQISGFIGTHQPAIWMGDYGYVTLMPEIGGSSRARSIGACRSAMPTRPRPPITTRCTMGDRTTASAIFAGDDRHRPLQLSALYLSGGRRSARCWSKRRGRHVNGWVKVDPRGARSSAITPTAWTPISAR